jgi:hypothetical protein
MEPPNKTHSCRVAGLAILTLYCECLGATWAYNSAQDPVAFFRTQCGYAGCYTEHQHMDSDQTASAGGIGQKSSKPVMPPPQASPFNYSFTHPAAAHLGTGASDRSSGIPRASSRPASCVSID